MLLYREKLHIFRRIFSTSAKGDDVIHLIAGRRALKSMLAQEPIYLSTGTICFRFRLSAGEQRKHERNYDACFMQSHRCPLSENK